MELTLLISFCLITVMVVGVIPKRIHLFELLFIWMVFTYLRADAYNFVLSLNEELLITPKHEAKFWVYILASYTVLPALIVACQNALYAVHSLLAKILIVILTVACLEAFESWEVAIHILERKNWSLYQSFLFWLIMVLVILSVNALFHRIVKKEVIL